MVILGIDPGYAIVGFGAVVYENNRFTVLGYGAITTRAHTEFTSRLEEIYDGMNELITKFRPDCISVEKLYFNTNTTTAIAVAESGGCILLAAKKGLVPVYEYTPLQVKSSVTGYGRAEKKQIMEMTRIMLGLEKSPGRTTPPMHWLLPYATGTARVRCFTKKVYRRKKCFIL